MKTEIKERIDKINRGQVPEGYKKSKFGIIPEDWDIKKLKEVTDYVDYRGKTPRKVAEGVFLVTAKNIKEGYIDYNISKEYVSEEEYDLIMKRGKPKIGDVLFTTEAPLGNVAQVDRENIALAQRVIKFRGKNNLSNDYLKYYLLGEIFQSLLKNKAIGSTVLGIQGKQLHNLEICVPLIEEQQKIADILSTWDKAIELKEKLIEQKKEQKKGLMQRLLTGKIRWNDGKKLSKFDIKRRLEMIRRGEVPEGYKKTKIGILPDDWATKKAKDIFENYSDKKHNGDLEVLSSTQDKGIIPRSQLDIDIKYDEGNLKNYKRVQKGNFIISLRSFQGGIEFSDYDGIISPAYTVLRNKIDIDHAFYRHLFKTEGFINRLSSVIYGIRDGKQIGYGDFGEMLLQYPSPKEQQQISNILNTYELEIGLLEQELESLKKQKKGLMQLLLAGKIRVKC